MKKVFILDGSSVAVTAFDENKIVDALPPAIYSIKFNPMTGFTLNKTGDSFDLPPKIYGSTNQRADRIITSYLYSTDAEAAMAVGGKGMGKTELMKVTANKMLEKGYPVIKVEENYGGSNFLEFIESLGEVVLFFDEFAKVYRSLEDNEARDEGQQALLSLFDGTSNGKRLSLITENNKHDINNLLLDRPGRVLRLYEYNSLEHAVIKQYAKDRKVKKKQIKALINYASTTTNFSMDMLQAIVQQHLLFQEPIKDLVRELNVPTPNTGSSSLVYKIVKLAYTDSSDYVVSKDEPVVIIGNEVNVKFKQKDGKQYRTYRDYVQNCTVFNDGTNLVLDVSSLDVKLHCVLQSSSTTTNPDIKSIDDIINSF